MFKSTKAVLLVSLLGSVSAHYAFAETALVTLPSLSSSLALRAAIASKDACGKLGFHISVSVVDASGILLITIRDDAAAPHTVVTSPRKAYTALTTRQPTSQLTKTVAANPEAFGLRQIEGLLILSGGIPIKVGMDTVGAIGVSGVPTPDGDERCASAGIAAISGDLQPRK